MYKWWSGIVDDDRNINQFFQDAGQPYDVTSSFFPYIAPAAKTLQQFTVYVQTPIPIGQGPIVFEVLRDDGGPTVLYSVTYNDGESGIKTDAAIVNLAANDGFYLRTTASGGYGSIPFTANVSP